MPRGFYRTQGVLRSSREYAEKFEIFWIRRMPVTVFDKIYEVVRKIPRGKVATYGQVAILAGNSRWARVVGYALHSNPDPDGIPCYRVLNRLGELAPAFAFGGAEVQAELLRADGIEVTDGRVELEKYLWDGL